MSNSRRKHPFCAVTCNGFDHGEKLEKRLENRRMRRANRVLAADMNDEIEPTPGTAWTWPKDGRQRFDPTRFPELMRK